MEKVQVIREMPSTFLVWKIWMIWGRVVSGLSTAITDMVESI